MNAPTGEIAEATGAVHAAQRPEFANFDYLRLFAAFAVLLHHAIFIAEGVDNRDPMKWLFGEEPTGTFAVCIFFIISGFLVTRSAHVGRSLGAYLAARVLRIYPGLFVCQLATALFIGGVFSHLAFADYLAHGYPFAYALHFTLDPGMTWTVPTVAFYQDTQSLGPSFNASLWSIQQELVCYAIVALLLATRLLRWPVFVCLLLLSLPFFVPWSRDDADIIAALFDWHIAEQRFEEFFWVGSSFFAGALVYFWWARAGGLPRWPLAVCLLLAIGAVAGGRVFDLFPLYAAYPLLYWAVAPHAQLPSLARFGDISYGVYLYGWPFEQTVRASGGPGTSWLAIFLLAGCASAIAAWLSWHYVERPALSLKRRIRRRPPLAVAEGPSPV